MDKLNLFYTRIQNPIDNKTKWNKILSIYSSSYDYNDFEKELTNINKSVNPYYINDDKERLSLIMWSMCKNKLLGFDEEKIYEYKTKSIFESNIYDIIKTLKELDSINEYYKLRELLQDEQLKYYYNYFFNVDENSNVTVASNFDVVNDYSYNTVFTVTIASTNLYKFLIDYINIIQSKEIDFLIKFNECGKYIIVNIYSPVYHIVDVEESLSIILKENYGFHYDNIYNALSGDIDDYISIKNRTYFNLNDYNNSRCLIIFKSLDSVLYSYVMNHLDIMVSYKDGRMDILNYISNSVTDRVLYELVSKSAKSKIDYYNIANSDNIGKLRMFINDRICTALPNILKENLYLKDGDYKVNVILNENKNFDIDASIFMYAIRNLTSTLILKDNGIENAFKKRIKNECLFKKVDPDKFCLDKSFTDKILYNEEVMKAYESELSTIKDDIKKLNELEGMFTGEATEEERQKIAANMKELLEHFSE